MLSSLIKQCSIWVAVMMGGRHVRCNETDLKLKFVKRDAFTPGFNVWAGVSFYGKTSLI